MFLIQCNIINIFYMWQVFRAQKVCLQTGLPYMGKLYALFYVV